MLKSALEHFRCMQSPSNISRCGHVKCSKLPEKGVEFAQKHCKYCQILLGVPKRCVYIYIQYIYIYIYIDMGQANIQLCCTELGPTKASTSAVFFCKRTGILMCRQKTTMPEDTAKICRNQHPNYQTNYILCVFVASNLCMWCFRGTNHKQAKNGQTRSVTASTFFHGPSPAI